MRVLGIETSCDDTAVAILDDRRVLAERAVTQEAHRRYLGVVPELASREHLELLFPLLDEVLAEAGLRRRDLDGVAVTAGPGLVGCLLVGVTAAKALAYALEIPVVGVNHIHAHLVSAFIDREPPYPFLGMVVSGGHTELFEVRGLDEIELLGSTLDDAAGEAFDKVAKLLGLGYPGGVEIDRHASRGNPTFAAFPRALLGRDTLDVSFSGLKTAVRSFVASHPEIDREGFVDDVAASFQAAVVDVLVDRMERAIGRHPVAAATVCGGVAQNRELRERMRQACTSRGVELHLPEPRYCGDNAVMVARWGIDRLQRGERSGLSLGASASLEAVDAALDAALTTEGVPRA
jgi:N6-L-threonylcarbamoyladenine synthase